MPFSRSSIVCEGARAPRRRGIVPLLLTALIGAGTLAALQGCQTMQQAGRGIIDACISEIAKAFNQPLSSLPAGYGPCGEPQTWTVQGSSVRICAYCSPYDPGVLYLQHDCSGPFYPYLRRPVTASPATGVDTGVHIESVSCAEQLRARMEWQYDQWSKRVHAGIKLPNDRVFPDPSDYPDLTILVDGAAVRSRSDFVVGADQQVTIAGGLPSVAYYAMTAGLRQISFRDGQTRYELFLNPDISAMMLFKDGVCIQSGLIFAPAS